MRAWDVETRCVRWGASSRECATTRVATEDGDVVDGGGGAVDDVVEVAGDAREGDAREGESIEGAFAAGRGTRSSIEARAGVS